MHCADKQARIDFLRLEFNSRKSQADFKSTVSGNGKLDCLKRRPRTPQLVLYFSLLSQKDSIDGNHLWILKKTR
jgi:hypothetical protein